MGIYKFTMDLTQILTNPGLEHIKENILEHLDLTSLENCCLVCHDWNSAISRVFLRKRIHFVWNDFSFFEEHETDYDGEYSYDYGYVKQIYRNVYPRYTDAIKYLTRIETSENLRELFLLLKDGVTRHLECINDNDFDFEHSDGCCYVRKELVEPLYNAAEKGNVPCLQMFAKTSIGEKLLLDYVCKYANIEVVKEILGKAKELGINPSIQDHYGKTQLHRACKNGRFEIVKEMLEKATEYGINPNIQDKNGKTPLHYACEIKYEDEKFETVKEMLEKATELGINPNIQDENGKTPLHYACETEYYGDADDKIETIKEMLEKATEYGIDWTIRDNTGKTAREIADWPEIEELFERFNM